MHALDDVLAGRDWLHLARGDVLQWTRQLPSQSVDLTFGSPPYADKRPYCGAATVLSADEWVGWMVEVYRECLRVTRGPVLFVVDGTVSGGCFDCTPQRLVAALHAAGVRQERPNIYFRYGTPGKCLHLRNLYENVVFAFNRPDFWVDNTAMGRPPKFKAGGPTSARTKSGERSNKNRKPYVPTERTIAGNAVDPAYSAAELAFDAGETTDVVDCGAVGGGRIGSRDAHANQAPFPEYLAEFHVRTFCPPSGIVYDPFVGSGTTVKVALQCRRRAVGVDIDLAMVGASERRCSCFIPQGDD